ncbi:murein L,D-transpeptidase, partial [Amycolatopsis sp. SID8362]|nr:murein L,D-transpeptidase [Amycolatopsis sp. SID8362]NED48415.1 murein L,D-transpeptidase [Amycolatopsis sp. SID8362]
MRGTGVLALLGFTLVTAACSAPRATTPSPIADPVPRTRPTTPTATAPPCAVPT